MNLRHFLRTIANIKYRGYNHDHVFNINFDDVNFKMTFLDYPLGRSIIQRIEGRRELETVSIIRSIVKRGSKVLELGGCYGYFTAIMSNCVGPDGKVVSIEGTPNNYRILVENIRINNIGNVETHNVFVTTKKEKAYFDNKEKHPYNAISRLKDSQGEEEEQLISVPTIKLSTFLPRINFTPDYIFMDIEGFEIDVFEDISKAWLINNRPLICFEKHLHFYKKSKGLSFIFSVLQRHNYHYRQIANNVVCFPE